MNAFQREILSNLLKDRSINRIYWSPDVTPGYIDIGVGKNKIYIFESHVEVVIDGSSGSGKKPHPMKLCTKNNIYRFFNNENSWGGS